MFLNSVVALRDREMLNVHRPFIARGSSLKRCHECMLAKHYCICSVRPNVQSSCAFCFIFYQGEVFKPSNTGRLIADVVEDNYAFQWKRTELDPELKALLHNSSYLPIVVFPHEYAQASQCIKQVIDLEGFSQGKKPLYVLLDGTWREAKKMFRSEYLQRLPVLGLQPTDPSEYALREAAHLHQLCTAEVGVEVLKLQGDTDAALSLKSYFQVFRERYLAGKANIILKDLVPTPLVPSPYKGGG
ncbi:MAG: DTW domain-containing protein YfiP [Oleiphilaceae bacterium]|jgi:DTW domain-containing protein YfiP